MPTLVVIACNRAATYCLMMSEQMCVCICNMSCFMRLKVKPCKYLYVYTKSFTTFRWVCVTADWSWKSKYLLTNNDITNDMCGSRVNNSFHLGTKQIVFHIINSKTRNCQTKFTGSLEIIIVIYFN